MADVEKSVRIAFKGDDQISKTIQDVTGKIGSMSDSLRGVTAPLADMAAAVEKTELALAALAIGGLALAVKTAGEFGDSFNEISTLIDVPADKINQFRQDVLNYAADSTASIDSINTAIYNAISAGVGYEDSLIAVAQAEKLRVAGAADLDSTLKVLVSSMNAYAAGSGEAESYSDALFTTVKLGQTTMTELGSTIGTVTAIAAQGKVPFTTLNAAIAALTATGVQTPQAITSLRAAIVGIINPSTQAAAEAKRLEIEFNAEALAAKGLEGVLTDVYVATGGNTQEIAKLFGRVEALNAALILGSDTSGRFADALQAMESRAGATERAYEKMSENFELSNQRIVNSIQATLINIGAPLLDEYKLLADSIAGFFNNLQVGIDSDAFDPVFAAIQTFIVDVADYIDQVGVALPDALAAIDFSSFLESIEDIGDAAKDLFQAFFGDLDLTKPEDLEKAIQKIVDSFSALNNITAGILDALEPFIDKLGDAVDVFLETEDATQKAVGQILGFGQGVDQILKVLPTFLTGIESIGTGLSLLAGATGLRAVTNITGLGAAAAAAATPIATFVAAVAAFPLGYWFGTEVAKASPRVREFTDSVLLAADRIVNFTGTQDVALLKTAQQTQELGAMRAALVLMGNQIDLIPEIKITKFRQVAEPQSDEWNDIAAQIAHWPEFVDTKARVAADVPSATNAKKAIELELGEAYVDPATGQPGGTVTTLIQTKVDPVEIAKAKAELDGLPTEKAFEIKLQGDIDIQLATITAAAQTAQTALEMKAKVDITEIEQAQTSLRTISDNISAMFIAAGDTISTALSSLSGLSGLDKLDVFRIIEAEQRIQADLASAQIDLANKQIAYLDERTKAMQSGDALIKFELDGVYPALELVMWEVVSRMQTRANAEGVEFLLGLT